MRCKICKNSHQNSTYEAREMMYGFRDKFTYLECQQCGCVQIVEIPSDMSKYYPASYYSLSISPTELFKNPIKKVAKRLRDSYAILNKGIIGMFFFDRYPEYILQSLSKTKITRSSRILDVGCGSGSLLYSLKNAGFHRVLGIDPYIENELQYKNGLMIMRQSIHQVTGEWDLIMFHHSFEHVPDPLETLRVCSTLLANEGVCLIRMPTVSSFAWRHYRTNWVQLDAPRHFFLHSTESIKLLSSRAGLQVAHISYDSTELQFWGSEQYTRDIPLESERSYHKNPSESIFSTSEIRAFTKKARQLNLQNNGDQAAYYLTKV